MKKADEKERIRNQMEYIVAGYNMLNDLNFADGRKIKNELGGSVFSLAGIKLWRDSLAYVGIAGKDFLDYYGEFLLENQIAFYVEERLSHTLYYVLDYFADGSFRETCLYGEDYEEEAYDNSKYDASFFTQFCNEETKGIYLEASLDTQIVYEFDTLKKMMPNGKIMWEIVTSDLHNPERKDKIIELIGHVDYYSMNFNEAKAFFSVDTEAEAISELLKIKKPCFFRVGEKGAYLIQDGSVTFLAAIGTEECVGETGCGNCSTAAALIGLAECKSPIEILAMANISAAYNAKQYGPWKRTDEKTRMEAEALKAKIMAKNQKNAQDE